jgi:uncharacterized membrane protein
LKFDSRDMALTAVFAALYVIVNVLQMFSVGNPTVYGPVQLRVADCLIALAALLGYPVIGGVTIGCFLTNAYYFIGVEDVVFGPIANLMAATIIFVFRKHRFIACVAGALPIGFIVGGYLSLIFSPPDVLSTLPAWTAMIVSITISSLIAIVVIGYLLLSILSRPNILEPLKSRGLKVIAEDQ